MDDFKKIQIIREYFFDVQNQYPFEIEKKDNIYELISNENLINGWKYARSFLDKIPKLILYGKKSVDFSVIFPPNSKKTLRLNSFTEDKPVYYGQIKGINIVLKASPLINPPQAYILALIEQKVQLLERVQKYKDEISKAIFDSITIQISINGIVSFVNDFLKMFPPVSTNMIQGTIDLKKAFKIWITKQLIIINNENIKLTPKQQDLLKTNMEYYLSHFSQIKLINISIDIINELVGDINSNTDIFQKIGECTDGLKEAAASHCASYLAETHYCPFVPLLYGTFLARRYLLNELNSPNLLEMLTERVWDGLEEPLSRMLENQIVPYDLGEKEWKELIKNLLNDIAFQSINNYFLYTILVEQHGGNSMESEQMKLHKKDPFNNSRVLESLISQGLMAIYCLAKGCGIGHGDLNLLNVTIEPIDKNTQFYFKIKKGGEYFYYHLPSAGYQLRLIDMERAYHVAIEKDELPCFRTEVTSNSVNFDVGIFLSDIKYNIKEYEKNDDRMRVIYGGPRILIKTLYNVFFPNGELHDPDSIVTIEDISAQFPVLMNKISETTFSEKNGDLFIKAYIE